MGAEIPYSHPSKSAKGGAPPFCSLPKGCATRLSVRQLVIVSLRWISRKVLNELPVVSFAVVKILACPMRMCIRRGGVLVSRRGEAAAQCLDIIDYVGEMVDTRRAAVRLEARVGFHASSDSMLCRFHRCPHAPIGLRPDSCPRRALEIQEMRFAGNGSFPQYHIRSDLHVQAEPPWHTSEQPRPTEGL